MRPPRVYLAGPDVFLPNAAQVGAAKKAVCARLGLDAWFPLDGPTNEEGPAIDEGLAPADRAAAIFANNLAAIRASAGVIANVSPFRGPGVDDGTAFEIGFAAALGLPIAAYDDGVGDYAARVAAQPTPGDPYAEVEAFGLGQNLMIAVACAESLGVVGGPVPLPAGATARFELAAWRMAERLVVKARGGS